MKLRKIVGEVYKGGAIDWDRRLFDSLIPLPDGTSYNAYVVKGSTATALIDSADPELCHELMQQLEDVDKIDYIIANHAEQDHSGSIPIVLQKYPDAQVICSVKCKGMLVDHLAIPAEKIRTVNEGETLSLGNYTLEFISTPWVHWPETMSTYLREEKAVFTCDFFGSHVATTDLFANDRFTVYEAAKRYYAEIMMPFRATVQRNIEKIEKLGVSYICPSHGPVYRDPAFIIDAYKEWVNDTPKNEVVIPYVSMHGSTKMMVHRLVEALVDRGVNAVQFDLTNADLGKLAIVLVDAATIVIGTCTVHMGPHPLAYYATFLANSLRPKTKFASVIGSYGWANKTVEQVAALIPNLKAEILPTVMARGLPTAANLAEIDALADVISAKHKALGLV